MREVQRLRTIVDSYINIDPVFGSTLSPYMVKDGAPDICLEMADAARIANTGPMAAVAGAFACRVGRLLKQHFGLREVVVENGGDIYLDVEDEMVISIFAGQSPLSEKVGLRIPAKFGELGICTSSGTVGHSLSFGKADAVVIACRNAALADAYATGIANKVQSPVDIEPVLEGLESASDILSALTICQDKLGVRGEFELEILS